ncbi:MAG: hypothetical protein WC438_06055 [Candidatus Pacearchaeota archaeon]
MADFRCQKCHQLQFKYRIRGKKLEVEIKCYNCNSYSYFDIWLDKLNGNIEENVKFHKDIQLEINKEAKKC